MRYLSCDIVADHAYLVPIGDIHIGDKAFGAVGRKKLRGYLEWVLKTPNARIMLMGDVFNVASRHSKTSPFESSADEYEEAYGLFQTVAKSKQILGAIDGNHEARMIDMFGYSPLQALCSRLEIPYCGWSATIELNVGTTKQRKTKRYPTETIGHKTNQYFIYCHHTTGGGATLGGALNRPVKLQDMVAGVDVYLGGHNHQMATGSRQLWVPYPAGRRMVQRRITYVTCGSYLDHEDSYAERGMMAAGKLGSPRIRFQGYVRHHAKVTAHEGQGWDSRDVHVSI